MRALCMALPDAWEKIAWSEPTWRHKKVFAMYASAENHHGGGRHAVWLAAAPGIQEMLIEARPDAMFRPPYMGVKGWVGLFLDAVDDTELGLHIHNAYLVDAPPKLAAKLKEEG
ncbi:MAG: MmcQ/YjbR family DNA-binding protein [Rhodothermales bacterium]|nr:MmcQ/YjbR family DNA-binding protein [Rhodothermales bacterium]